MSMRKLYWRKARLWINICILLLSFCTFCLKFSKWLRAHKAVRSVKQSRRLAEEITKPKILYIVTSIHEYDNGRRSTTKGYDRFSNSLVPIARESVASMLKAGYSVDLYLITHYGLTANRYNEIRLAIPDSVGLEVWDDATPIGYAVEHSKNVTMDVTRALARQHRYVIKDHLLDYDIFCNFEDDMLLSGEHVEHYVKVTNELHRLRETAPEHLDHSATIAEAAEIFYGTMTKFQLARMIPGFIRVEAAVRGFKPHRKNLYAQIPIDYHYYNDTLQEASLDPSVCCHVSAETANDQRPAAPGKDQIFFWETSIDALGVRKMPESSVLDWVLLQAGNSDEFYEDDKYVIGDYWSGRDGYFGDEDRPPRTKGRYLNNMGGWMATRRQIFEWHCRWCRGGFLPPYDPPVFDFDGLDTRSVEYWSGGIQIVGVKSCNMQRIITLDPAGFSRHLLYHSSNNKQRARNVQHRFSSRSINQFWGQLNTVKKNAEIQMREELEELAKP